MAIQLSYGALNLQTLPITSVESDVWSPAQKNIQTETLAQSDGSVYVRDSLETKTFTVSGWIRAATIAELDAALDALYLGLAPSQQPFEIDNGTGKRRYIATAQMPLISRAKGQTSAGFSIAFTVPSGVGQDLTERYLIQGYPITAASQAIPIAVGGTYKTQPSLRLELTTVAGSGTRTVTITNGTSLRGMAITRTWANGDIVEIDSLNQTVYVNSISTPFSGMFPQWGPGVGVINYLDDFTSRSANLTARYTRRWL
ncbi:phage distal tail protein [Rathayibacter festucae]|uniref:Phage tail protein n=1 Tax=Rathayibacter festucae DSM 15932 TaxID=1328866 RepID=A0A3T0SYM9_9MICO|nr:phage tail domain-containing protein [Rathayibacter festucae]AZZ51433.1 hypothetical protein C1I64_04830 [Rathayibacter festucae DSM 15932]